MGFVGRSRMTIGPRGRNVSTSTSAAAMGYVRDDHAFTRGPGAIAALDAASPRRRVARARQLAEDARRDAARARVVGGMGALPFLPALKAAAAVKTLLPGQRMVPVAPGTVVTAKYPGIPGYRPPGTYGAPTKIGMPGGRVSVSAGGVRTSSNAPSGPVLGTTKPGLTMPGSVTLPQAGNVNPVTGQVDPGSAGGGAAGGGSSGGGDSYSPNGGGGGGGGGDVGTPGDGGSLLPDGTDAADGGTDTTTQSTDPNAGVMVAPAPTPIDTTPATSNTTRNWLIAGAVLLGGYWLLKSR